VLDLALVDFDQAMRLGFSDARAYNKRGLVWHEKGRYERAIADFTRAIKIDPCLHQSWQALHDKVDLQAPQATWSTQLTPTPPGHRAAD
jgi:tetratricopeptide (TPR) repeat protein